MLKIFAAALVAASMGMGVPAAAQEPTASYPSKPVRLIVGYQAGGPTDLTARLLATKLQAAFGQPFVVENKPGAGSNIASEFVANAAPDGYTLLIAAAPITMAGFMYKNLKWNVQDSFEPVSLLMSAPAVLAVANNVPAKTLPELLDLARKQPGKLSFGSTGNGGTQHLAGEMLKNRAGIDILHIPYKGAAGAMQDLLSGQVTMAFMTSVSAVPLLKEGKARPIAVAAEKRLPQLPQVPTMAEAGVPGFVVDSWNGMLAPKGTSPAIIARLHAEVAKAMAAPDVREKLEAQGAVVVGGRPAEFRTYIREEVSHWDKLLKTMHIKLD
ncbi:MAG TPA: tripartite tricarboxylate transporter substrate binding protein [Ramlibacter sp.]|uniref:Bug family tripartite tricarboxylate transporter substrate binding protein n=1 Tax=Ramlibacter sp. TaxID=1917967 RepID=UPI002ED5F201